MMTFAHAVGYAPTAEELKHLAGEMTDDELVAFASGQGLGTLVM